mgnify:FL=1
MNQYEPSISHSKSNEPSVVLSLYDYTGTALRPWAVMGYECHAYDIQHDVKPHTEYPGKPNGGSITYHHADLHNIRMIHDLYVRFKHRHVAFASAFPVCTDLSVAGARHFEAKRLKDPQFQTRAAAHCRSAALMFDMLGCAWYVENPRSVLASLWRPPDYRYHPWQYGGYIPTDQAEHPKWPQYVEPRDAYKKLTCLWTGGGFVMPPQNPVPRMATHGDGYATAMMKLGGSSMRTKNIRSASPRGFSKAVAVSNHDVQQTEHIYQLSLDLA